MKTWASTIKDDLALLSGPQVVGLRRWNREWLAISCDLAQDRRALAAMVRDAVLAREEAGSTDTSQVKISHKNCNKPTTMLKREVCCGSKKHKNWTLGEDSQEKE